MRVSIYRIIDLSFIFVISAICISGYWKSTPHNIGDYFRCCEGINTVLKRCLRAFWKLSNLRSTSVSIERNVSFASCSTKKSNFGTKINHDQGYLISSPLCQDMTRGIFNVRLPSSNPKNVQCDAGGKVTIDLISLSAMRKILPHRWALKCKMWRTDTTLWSRSKNRETLFTSSPHQCRFFYVGCQYTCLWAKNKNCPVLVTTAKMVSMLR